MMLAWKGIPAPPPPFLFSIAGTVLSRLCITDSIPKEKTMGWVSVFSDLNPPLVLPVKLYVSYTAVVYLVCSSPPLHLLTFSNLIMRLRYGSLSCSCSVTHSHTACSKQPHSCSELISLGNCNKAQRLRSPLQKKQQKKKTHPPTHTKHPRTQQGKPFGKSFLQTHCGQEHC